MAKLLRILTLTGPPAVYGKLRRVVGSALTGVWVAGDDTDGTSPNGTGAIYFRQWTGTAYVAQEVNIYAYVTDVAWISDTDLWYLSAEAYLSHWDGFAWTYVFGSPEFLEGLAAVSSTDITAIGSTGALDEVLYYHWNGTAWSGPTTVTIAHPGTPRGWDVFCIAQVTGSDRFVGAIGGLLNLSTASIAYTPGSGGRITAIRLLSSSSGFACNSRGGSAAGRAVVAYSSGTWADMATQPSYPDPVNDAAWLYAVDATSTSNVWVVGSLQVDATGLWRYLVRRWTGSAWVSHTVDTDNAEVKELLGVRVLAANDVWVVGYYRAAGVYYLDAWHWDGLTWTRRPLA